MRIKCKETVTSELGNILFTKDKVYDFVPVDNSYTRGIVKYYNLVGYVKRDDEGYKRWMGKEFKEKYFESV